MGTAVYLKRVFFFAMHALHQLIKVNPNAGADLGFFRVRAIFQKYFEKFVDLLLVDPNHFPSSHRALKRPSCGQTF